MIIDIIFVVLLILAVIKGYQRGLIVAVFSTLAIIIGLAAALKLSAVVAGYIGKAVKVSDKWLPFVSFIVVFLIVVILIRLGANLVQKTVETVMLGFVNRIGGIVFYLLIYIIVLSILIFYAGQMQLFKQETLNASVTYPLIKPWGPAVMNGLGSVIPIFKDMFSQLENFFGGISQKISVT